MLSRILHAACQCWRGSSHSRQARTLADGYTLWDNSPPGDSAPPGAPTLARASAPAASVDYVYQAVVGGAPALRAPALHSQRDHARGQSS